MYSMEASGVKRFLRVGAVLGNFTLAACGGYASSSIPNPGSGIYFKQATLQSGPIRASGAKTSAFFRRSTDCVAASNLNITAYDDPTLSVSGQLGGTGINGQTNINWSNEITGLGEANWLTSLIAGGYNVSEVQAYVGSVDGSANSSFIRSATIGTYGNTTVSLGVPTSSSNTSNPVSIISIINNGAPVNTIPLAPNASGSLTLSHGELISWGTAYSSDDVTTMQVQEIVNDSASGGVITTQIQYTPNYDAFPLSSSGMSTYYMDINVVAQNVSLGGYAINQALSLPSSGICATPTSSPTPVSTSAPTACPLPTATPTPGASATPYVHPTPSSSTNPCTS